MGNFFTNAQGRPDDMGVRVLRRRILFSQANIANGIPIGAIEKGGVPVRARVIINTAFNAGTTNVLVLGDKTTDNSLITSANAAANAAGAKDGTGVNLNAEAAADTIIYAKFTQTGTAATTGDATFIVEYVPAYPWSDNNGGQSA